MPAQWSASMIVRNGSPVTGEHLPRAEPLPTHDHRRFEDAALISSGGRFVTYLRTARSPFMARICRPRSASEFTGSSRRMPPGPPTCASRTTSAQSRGFADIRCRHGVADAFRNADLTDDVTEVVRRLRRHGLDVVVVDQTTPEHRAGGFSCVKAIVPGMLPMTFGHDNRRTHGLPRLFQVPKLLGYRDRTLLPQDVNPHP